MSQTHWCHVFVTESDLPNERYSIQFQLPALTIKLAAHNLSFAPKVISFIEETRGKPEFQDKHLGGGIYRAMPAKRVDLSSSFIGTTVLVEKDGEFDERYFLRMEQRPSLSMNFRLVDPQLEALLEALREIVDDFGDETEGD